MAHYDPNDPRRTESSDPHRPSAAGQPESGPGPVRASPLPLVIGVLLALAIGYFMLQYFMGQDRVGTTGEAPAITTTAPADAPATTTAPTTTAPAPDSPPATAGGAVTRADETPEAAPAQTTAPTTAPTTEPPAEGAAPGTPAPAN